MAVNSTQFFENVKGSSSVAISPTVELSHGTFISFVNKSGNRFNLAVPEVHDFMRVLAESNEEIANDITSHEAYPSGSESPWVYLEKPYRSLTARYFTLSSFPTINPLIGSQTAGVYNAISSYVAFLLERTPNGGPLLFDAASLKSALEILDKHASSFAAVEAPETKFRTFLGPFDSVKKAAFESLLFCFERYKEAFIASLTVDEDKAAPTGPGLYWWATQKAIDSGADARVFTQPFVINDKEYFLSDQWTLGSTKGRSIESLNDFLENFSYRVVSENGKFFLIDLTISETLLLPKPFLLFAGISGTGKTRFIREQAKAAAGIFGIDEKENYRLVPVRPDWHEPSDLLGYISRIGGNGASYVVTDVLTFIVAAWKHAASSADTQRIALRDLNAISPFWLCLDEMNLAPVEQYFADYLSVLETRKWEKGDYTCDPLLKTATIHQLDERGKEELWENLQLSGGDPVSSALRAYFTGNGIPLPPNLIVAGTVNMDETTHGFSRKVIDRALTFDFGDFFPNEFDCYYSADRKTSEKPLNFPRLSFIKGETDLAAVPADPDGRKTIAFLKAVKTRLDGTPFAIAFRSLNEVLLFVASLKPVDDTGLKAVWDDYLMMKVFPRIEGDAEKLCFNGEISLITELQLILKKQLDPVWEGKTRPDLFRKTVAGPEEPVECRSRLKLEWMQKRLVENGFTSFWP